IVKLFRVFLLFPVVMLIGFAFARRSVARDAARIPFPLFALVFVALCVLNSIAMSVGEVAPLFALIKSPLVEASTWGLLVAIGALGLGTSLPAIAALGWRHVATVTGTTVVILVAVTAALMLMRLGASKRLGRQLHDARGAALDAREVGGGRREHALHEISAGDELALHAPARVLAGRKLRLRGLHDPAPHVAERAQTEESKIVGRGGAGI